MPSLDGRLAKLEANPFVLAELARRRGLDPRWEALGPDARSLVAGAGIHAATDLADRIASDGGRVETDNWSIDHRLVDAAVAAAGAMLDLIGREGIEAARIYRETNEVERGR